MGVEHAPHRLRVVRQPLCFHTAKPAEVTETAESAETAETATGFAFAFAFAVVDRGVALGAGALWGEDESPFTK